MTTMTALSRRAIAAATALALAATLAPTFAAPRQAVAAELRAGASQPAAALSAQAAETTAAQGDVFSTQTAQLAAQCSGSYQTGKLEYGTTRATVGSNTFEAVSTGSNKCVLYKRANGKSEVLARNVWSDFVAGKRYVFYTKPGKTARAYLAHSMKTYKTAIYRLDMKTGKRKKIASGIGIVPKACSGKYLYYGRKSYTGVQKSSLYVFNLKSGKKRYVGEGTSYGVDVGKNRIVTCNDMDGGGKTLYSYRLNGKGRKTISKTAHHAYKVTKTKVYYMEYDFPSNVRVYRCDLDGSHKKALSGWRYISSPYAAKTLLDKYSK